MIRLVSSRASLQTHSKMLRSRPAPLSNGRSDIKSNRLFTACALAARRDTQRVLQYRWRRARLNQRNVRNTRCGVCSRRKSDFLRVYTFVLF